MSALRWNYSQPKCINTLKTAINASETALTGDLLSLREGRCTPRG
jgi:hypothetical protein